MIVTEKAQEEVPKAQDAPPPYPSTSSPTESGGGATYTLTPTTQAVNFVSIIRIDESIKDSFAIDPSLSLPPSLLPPLAQGQTEEDRGNLKLETRDGSIDAHVFLVNNVVEMEKGCKVKPTTVNSCSRDGSVAIRIHTAGSAPHRPIHARVKSRDGSINVHIPRSFNGLLSIHRRHGSIRFSSDLKAQLTLLGDEQGILRAVIGDIQNFYVSRDEEWIGDLLELQSNDGSVSVRYDDEIGKRQGISGFLSRFLNQ